ncbi:sideroflexin-4 isoform X2 [Heteronotia binoei]|uniref:sideroflexin-4 isoform X2 n=1 Tax=Heteronotia binoei TaxID=13085 RepID=UPI00292F85D4|nr:sideroflexin-4 isoform X2 [Heteronotia binoei]
MDLNLQFWKSEGKTFTQRFRHWIDILDPLLIFKSRKEIETSRTLLLTSGPDITKSLQNKKIKEAWKLSLASVNPVSGDIVPSVFRLPAFLPIIAPLELPYKQMLFSAGAVLYSASLAAFPHYIMTRCQVQSPSMQLFLKAMPGPLTATLCAFNVLVMRASELESGIEVMDSKGNIVGVSQKAGEKAVIETALCRAVMIGTAVCIPDIVLHYLKRTYVSLQHPRLCGSLRSVMVVSILGLMVPITFSWIPQLGTIQRSLIEPEIISSTEETEFFYNRGL